MEQDNGKPFDMKEEIGKVVKSREEKWNTFFERYEEMDELQSDEELVNFNEDEENAVEIIEESEEESGNSSLSCIEVSDEEDEEAENMDPGFDVDDFEQAYKAVAQNTIKRFERVREEHMKEEVKTKGMTRRLSKSVIEKQAVTTTPVMQPASISKALALTNTQHVPANNDCNSLDAVQSQTITAPELVEKEFMEGGVIYVQQVMTTTTTTTTTTIIKRSEGAEMDEDIKTPMGGTPGKKARQSDEYDANPFDYADNDYYATPQANRRKSRFSTPSQTNTPHNLLAIANTPHRIVVTPKAANTPNHSNRPNHELIKKNEIKKQLKKELADHDISKKEWGKIDRNIRVEDHQTVAVLVCPEQVKPEPQDFMGGFRSRKSTLIVKEEC